MTITPPVLEPATDSTLDALAGGLAYASRSPVLRTPADVGLAFDFRNHGHTAAANGGLQSNNRFEARDVVGTLAYIRSRPDLADMAIGLFARCMGANATFRAAHEHPGVLDDVRCLVAPLLLSPEAFVDTTLESMGLAAHADEVARRLHRITGAPLEDGTVSAWAPSISIPTLTYGVHDDSITRPADLEEAYDAIGTDEKSMFWIRDTTARWDGYTYFQRHPQRILDWFTTHLH